MLKKISIVIIIMLMIIGYAYYNSIYSLNDIQSLISKDIYDINNCHINIEFYNEENNSTESYDCYKKDNLIYIVQNSIEAGKVETLTNTETQETILILHSPKIINKTKTNNKEIEIFALSEFEEFVKNNGNYKYCGKENINSKKCIKMSFSLNENLQYFYIDLESGNIVQTELYKNSEKKLTTAYNYIYNSVTDEDILQFDINNYSDYLYNEI